MKFIAWSLVLCSFSLGCQPSDQRNSPDTDVETDDPIEEEDEEDTGEKQEDACPGDFPSGLGPGCCSEDDQLTPDSGRATCEAGEWTCELGEICSCQGEVAMYECLDACEWEVTQPAGCIFGDHFECFNPTEVPANSCE